MKSAKFVVFVAVVIAGSVLLLGQTQPNFENGFKSHGSYDGNHLDSVNLMNGNLQVHIPLPFSYPQRGGRIDREYQLQAFAKGWHADSYSYSCSPGTCQGLRWGQPPNGVKFVSSTDITVNRVWQSDAPMAAPPAITIGATIS